MENSGLDPELLRRYFAGSCSAEEREKVRAWLASAGSMPEADEESLSGIDPESLGAGMREYAKSRPGPLSDGLADKRIRAPTPPKASLFWKLAACLILFLGAGYFARAPILALMAGRAAPNAEYRVHATAKGQKARIVLADGTRILLNSDSEIRYPTAFSASGRPIRLRGEAYFQVAKDSLRPFTVETADTRTRVLGTAFNVRAYPEETATWVAVEEGRVSFAKASPGADTLLLTAGLAGRSQSGDAAPSLIGSSADQLAWKDNRLVFKDKTLAEIGVDLERWYGLTVDIRPPALAQARFTGSYANPDLKALLKDMSLAAKFRFTLHHKALILERP